MCLKKTMLFLIEYNRKQGRIVNLERFVDSDRREAQDRLLELELRFHAEVVQHEVVLLEADCEETIRKTHPHYFYDLPELIAKLKEALAA
jgi:hypothetical protein